MPPEAVYSGLDMGEVRRKGKPLFEAARAGDAGAATEIDRLLRGFARDVCARGLPRGSSDFDWEDVAQEASRRVFTMGLSQFRSRGTERAYLYSIVKTTAIQMVRAAHRRRSREELYATDRPVQDAGTHSRLDVRELLNRVDPDCRKVIERVLLLGESYASLANEMGLAEPSVRSRLSRCLTKARKIAGVGDAS